MANNDRTDYMDVRALTRPVGTEFWFQGRLLVVEALDKPYCRCCAFAACLCSRHIHVHGLCTSWTRSDKQNVHFVISRNDPVKLPKGGSESDLREDRWGIYREKVL